MPALPALVLALWRGARDPSIEYAVVWRHQPGVLSKLPNLKVIFVSGYAEESVRRDIEDDQSVEFLPKPYSLDQINTKVKEVLQKIGKDDEA